MDSLDTTTTNRSSVAGVLLKGCIFEGESTNGGGAVALDTIHSARRMECAGSDDDCSCWHSLLLLLLLSSPRRIVIVRIPLQVGISRIAAIPLDFGRFVDGHASPLNVATGGIASRPLNFRRRETAPLDFWTHVGWHDEWYGIVCLLRLLFGFCVGEEGRLVRRWSCENICYKKYKRAKLFSVTV